MPSKLTVGAWLKSNIRGQWISPRFIGTMTRTEVDDVHIFDARGAVRIYGPTSRKLYGKKGIAEIGGGGSGDSTAIWRPGAGNRVNSAKAMDNYFGWTYTAINATADEAANVQFTLFRVKKDGKREQVEEHEILDLLDSMNDTQTGYEFKHTLTAHLRITGNAYMLLMKGGKLVTSDTEQPDSFWLLNPGRMNVMLNKLRFPYLVDCYMFQDEEGKKHKFLPHQIVHIRCPNPSNPYMGVGAVQGIAEWIDNDNYSTEFLKNFFVNGARIQGILETEMTSEEQLEELKITYEERYAGVKNAYKTMALPKGVKFIPNTQSFTDIGLPELTASSRDKILAGFRVSKTILGAAESETNRATAETADYVFSKRTVKPLMELIVSFLNQFLVPRFGETDLILDFVDPVPEDRVTRMTEMNLAIGGQAVMTINEAREEYLGLPPIDGGDELARPSDLMQFTNGMKKDAKVKEKSGGKKPVRTQFARNAELRRNVGEALKAALSEKLESLKKKALDDMSDQEYEEVIYKSTRSRSEKYEVEVTTKLREINAAQEKEVLANLPSAVEKTMRRKAIAADDLFDLDTWVQLTIDLSAPIFGRQFKEESEYAAANVGKPNLDVFSTPEAKRALNEAVSLMADSYNRTIREALISKLNEGLTQGMSLSEMTSLVEDVYEFSDEYSAKRVARTETVRTANTANKMAWEQAGNVKSVKWYVSGKDNVCPLCASMNGKTIPIDKNFFEIGDTVEGQDGTTMTVDYSDVGGPPLHPQCGCIIRPWDIEKSMDQKPVDPEADDSEVAAALDDINNA